MAPVGEVLRGKVVVILVTVGLIPLAVAVNPSDSPDFENIRAAIGPLKADSERYSDRAFQASGVGPTDFAVYTAPGVTGHALAADLHAAGFDVGAVGAEALNVLLSRSDLIVLAEHPSVRWIDTRILTVPTAYVTEAFEPMQVARAHAVDRNGTGVKVAVFDLGFDPTHPEISASVKGTKTFDGSSITSGYTTHGTACAEIILDIAPGVDLYLVKTLDAVELENALDWAIAEGINVISASIGMPVGPFDGTSAVDLAVDRATAAGIHVVVSAGNSAGHHWAGPWFDTDADNFLNFLQADETINVDLTPGESVVAYLSWDDFPSSDQDYDLIIVDDQANLLAYSLQTQDGAAPPYEAAGYTANGYETVHVVIMRSDARGDAHFHLFFDHSGAAPQEYVVPEGSIVRPATAVSAISVGAVGYAAPHDYHSYSSRGPLDDGRGAPVIASAAGVSTASYAPNPFFGTSAAAPHVAGMLSLAAAEPPSRYTNMTATLRIGSEDIGAPGFDNLTGWGWSNAWSTLFLSDWTPPAVESLAIPPTLAPRLNVTVNVTFTDHLAKSQSMASARVVNSAGARADLAMTTVAGRAAAFTGTLPTNFSSGNVTLIVQNVTDYAYNQLESEIIFDVAFVDADGPQISLPNGTDVSNLTGEDVISLSIHDLHGSVNVSSTVGWLDGHPIANASWNMTTETWSFRLEGASVGFHSLNVSSSDNVGNGATANFTLRVRDAINPVEVVAFDAAVLTGRTVTIPVLLRNVTDFGSMSLRIRFNESQFNLTSLVGGNVPNATFIFNAARQGERSLLIQTADVPGPSGNFTLFYLNATAAGIPGSSEIAFELEEFVDSNGGALSANLRGPRLNIGLRGDANGDGRVSGVDALFIRQYVVGNRAAETFRVDLADVNGDGRISGVDALFIAQFVVGTRTTL